MFWVIFLVGPLCVLARFKNVLHPSGTCETIVTCETYDTCETYETNETCET